MIKTGFIWDKRYLEHDVGDLIYTFSNGDTMGATPEFENPKRAVVIKEMLEKTGMASKMTSYVPYEAEDKDLLRVHTKEHIQHVVDCCEKGVREIGPEAYAIPVSEKIARLSAGGAMKAVDVCLGEGDIDQAYALIRPPGHHAESNQAMGFCLYNNASVAASYARETYGAKKVLILDWDVHHGNGTEEIFYENDDILVISIHEEAYFPLDTGQLENIGEGKGKGYNINIPLPPLTGDEGYMLTFEEVIEPVIRQYQPDLILVSAGQDANALDPLARMMVLRSGFRYMGRKIRELAEEYSNGKLAILQEGGYSLHYLPVATLGVIEGLMNVDSEWEDPHLVPERELDPKVIQTLNHVKKVLEPYWIFNHGHEKKREETTEI
ncbi:class II histone deacetylase [Alteribacillus iranensis]|uniref:Acetoin utilization deacetylase AcuC n=1 Tax=Alteribacillus iranensis TaxID=930128 RepID=A0A1I2E1T6_9BACI|nr:class II histone deacetylase [Alteribacillus iranensis]SFE86844.1 Acetoin utilization deacetylase AcuC [Alteribacillus iranensis]